MNDIREYVTRYNTKYVALISDNYSYLPATVKSSG